MQQTVDTTPVQIKAVELTEHPTTTPQPEPVIEVTSDSQDLSSTKISALSLSSIRAKKALLDANKLIAKDEVHLPTEEFTQTDMLLQWNKYAQRLGDKGFRIMESLLLMNDPILKGTDIILELPNEGSKIDFEKEMNGLLGHLRGHLHNHTITITVVVNEAVTTRQAFTAQEKFNRLCVKNPNLELLRKIFDLD
jgi:DNA polymerase-3 subunit gamma/tau